MTAIRWIATWAAFAALAFPALSLADHHEVGEDSAAHQSDNAGSKAGGKAAEHRSEKAAEKSNAQWDENNEGRPEKRLGDDDAAEVNGDDDAVEVNGDDDQDKDKQDKQEKPEKKSKKDKKSKQDKSPKASD